MTKRDKKIQSYIFKCLLADTCYDVHYIEYDEGSVAVTWSGRELYVLPKEDICFDLGKCKESPALRGILDMTADDTELTLTDTLVQEKKDYYRKLKADSFCTWVNDKLLKDFGESEYYAHYHTYSTAFIISSVYER